MSVGSSSLIAISESPYTIMDLDNRLNSEKMNLDDQLLNCVIEAKNTIALLQKAIAELDLQIINATSDRAILDLKYKAIISALKLQLQVLEKIG